MSKSLRAVIFVRYQCLYLGIDGGAFFIVLLPKGGEAILLGLKLLARAFRKGYHLGIQIVLPDEVGEAVFLAVVHIAVANIGHISSSEFWG